MDARINQMVMSIAQEGGGDQHFKGVRPKKSLGQHFLKDKKVICDILALLEPEKGCIYAEIGPGKGQLTFPFLERERERGSHNRYFALEKDDFLAENLKKALKTYDFSAFAEVIHGDAIDEIPRLTTRASTEDLVVFGNIPYYLTGKLMRTLWDLPKPPKKAVFMVQWEVAERIGEEKGPMSKLRAAVEFWGKPSIAFKVPKNRFSPPPKVDSGVVVITGKEGSEKWPDRLKGTYEEIFGALFSQPRKTALNNLSAIFGDKKTAEEFIRSLKLEPAQRPHEISSKSILAMAEVLYNERNGAQKK
jgi:16S rRNA (adenine1518-N6/adenine1519-N6)-dimethyltransferase